MQLTLRDVAELLGVPEKTVRHWIETKGLPAHRVREQWRFNRAEIVDWMAHRRPGSHSTKFDRSRLFAGHGLPLSDALEAGDVLADVAGEERDAVLQAAVARMSLPEAARPMLLDFLLARGLLASTAVGDGIAIPHGRCPIVLDVSAPRLTVCHLARPIPYDAPDGKPVATLFLLVSPTVRAHLEVLGRLSTALADPGFRGAIGHRAGKPQVVAEARRVEEALASQAAAAAARPGEEEPLE